MVVSQQQAEEANANANGGEGEGISSLVQRREVNEVTVANLTADASCGAVAKKVKAPAHMAWGGTPLSEASKSQISAAAEELARYFRESAGCGSAVVFAQANDAVLGAYGGADLVKSSVAELVETGKKQLENGVPGQLVVESCPGASNKGGVDVPFGVFADLRGNISAVQDALRVWANGECLDIGAFAEEWDEETEVEVEVLTSPFDSSHSSDTLHARGDCRVIQVVSGDSCASLATRCGISGNEFEKYNSYNSKLCSTLKPKQYVCCNSGTLPDMRPKPNADGTCKAYTVQKDDGCWAIADSFGITQDDIANFNKQTWGWAGCGSLMQGQVICISTGDPPMPSQDQTMNWYVAVVQDAVVFQSSY